MEHTEDSMAAGDMRRHESITGEASGPAEVEVFGSPTNVNISKSGVAHVTLQG